MKSSSSSKASCTLSSGFLESVFLHQTDEAAGALAAPDAGSKVLQAAQSSLVLEPKAVSVGSVLLHPTQGIAGKLSLSSPAFSWTPGQVVKLPRPVEPMLTGPLAAPDSGSKVLQTAQSSLVSELNLVPLGLLLLR